MFRTKSAKKTLSIIKTIVVREKQSFITVLKEIYRIGYNS